METFKRTYFSPISDVGFKKLFASEQNEDLRLQLLNSIITDGSPVVETQILDPVHPISAETTATFDLYCRREDGSRIIVEMQRAVSPSFLDRALAYSSLAFLDQWHSGWEYKVDRVYFIGIVDRILFRGRPDKPLTTVKLMTVDEPVIVVNEKYLQIFVELPKLAGVSPDKMSAGELFLSAMRGLHEWDERPAAYRDKSLDRLFTQSAYRGLTDDEQAKHDKEMTTERDYQEEKAYIAAESFKEGKAEGRIEGRIEGREEGAAAARLETARSFKAAGVDLLTIANCTGIPLETVKDL